MRGRLDGAWNRDLPVAAWSRLSDRLADRRHALLDTRPAGREQDHDANGSVGQVLLVLEIPVRGQQNFEACLFSESDQLAVFQIRPSTLVGALNSMFRKFPAQRQGRPLVEEDLHLGGRERTPSRVFKNSLGLVDRHAGEPIDELMDRGVVFEVLEQRGDRNASPPEHPSSAHATWVALYSGARRPVNHVKILAPTGLKRNGALRSAPSLVVPGELRSSTLNWRGFLCALEFAYVGEVHVQRNEARSSPAHIASCRGSTAPARPSDTAVWTSRPSARSAGSTLLGRFSSSLKRSHQAGRGRIRSRAKSAAYAIAAGTCSGSRVGYSARSLQMREAAPERFGRSSIRWSETPGSGQGPGPRRAHGPFTAPCTASHGPVSEQFADLNTSGACGPGIGGLDMSRGSRSKAAWQSLPKWMTYWRRSRLVTAAAT